MADINIERKRPSIWPWVVGLLVLALLIWAIAAFTVGSCRTVTETSQPPAMAAPTAPRP